MKMSTIIRLVLSAVIIYFVYQETGIATTIFAITITIAIELQSRIQNIQKIFNDSVYEYIEAKDGSKSDFNKTQNKKKSKWQQRIEEMQKAQDEIKAKVS